MKKFITKTMLALSLCAIPFTSFADTEFATTNINHTLTVDPATCSMDIVFVDLFTDDLKLNTEYNKTFEVPINIFNPAGKVGSIQAEFDSVGKTTADEDYILTVAMNNYFENGGTNLASPFGTQSFADATDNGMFSTTIYIQIKAMNYGQNVFRKEGSLNASIKLKQTC